MDNQFVPYCSDGGILFFTEKEVAMTYYETNHLTVEWNVEANFKQFIQLILYAYDNGMRNLYLCTTEQRVEINLNKAFWLIKRISKQES